jgi:hypothetical protein
MKLQWENTYGVWFKSNARAEIYKIKSKRRSRMEKSKTLSTRDGRIIYFPKSGLPYGNCWKSDLPKGSATSRLVQTYFPESFRIFTPDIKYL